MNELANWVGLFEVFDNPGYTAEELRAGHWRQYRGIEPVSVSHNLLMAAQKLAMANAVFPQIARLVITSQTGAPVDTETEPGGTALYTTVDADEFSRGAGNPYQIAWNITSAAANGNWGSFCLVDAAGNLINRALAGVTKSAGVSKIVAFTGSVS